MSSIVNKVKEAVSGHKTDGTTHSHSSSSADPRVNATTGTTTGTHNGSYTSSDNYSYGTQGPASRTDGPHGSNLANRVDPRIDSDADNSRNMGMNPSGTATTSSRTPGTTGSSGLTGSHGTTGSGLTGSHGTTGNTSYGTQGPASRTDGPHSSNLGNRLDPRIDSDADNSRHMGMNPSGTATTSSRTPGTTTGTSGLTGSHGTTGSGLTGSHGTTGNTSYGTQGPASRTDGPHSSNLANRVDPRIDSDADNSRNMGMNPSGTSTTGRTTGTHTSGVTGSTGSSGLTGSHGTTRSSGVTGSHNTSGVTGSTGSSGLTGSHGTTGSSGVTGSRNTSGVAGSTGPGPAPNTAGPHSSDAMNKLDPRVDSDQNGSRTIGGDKTYSRPTDASATAYKDPTDAAQVPPSVFQKHVGPPTVEHNDHTHDRARRHSLDRREGHFGL